MAKSKKKKQSKQGKQTSKTTAFVFKDQPDWFTNKRLHAFIIMAFAFLLYANTLSHSYTQDDAIVIYDNMYTTDGLAGIPGILKYDTFKGFFKREGKDKLVSGGRYRPLTLILFAIEWQLSAKVVKGPNGQPQKDANGKVIKEGRPFISHLINILLLGLTGLCLYWLLLALLTEKGQLGYAYFVALAAALLFIAHPIHTEAVANIKGRDEIVSLLGSLGAAYLSWKAYKEGAMKWGLLAGGLFFLALMSKENAITFVAVIPLMYFVFSKADTGQIVKQSLPFLVAAIAFVLLRFSVLNWGFGEESGELMNNPFLKLEGNTYVPLSGGERSATIMYTIGQYIKLLFFPHPLTHDYYPRHVAVMSWGNWQVLLSLIAFLGLIGYSIRALFKKDHLAFAILFYLITFSIVSNVLFPIGTNMAERLLFMPSVGFCLAMAILLYRLAGRQAGGVVKTFKQLNTSLIVLGVALVLLGFKTVNRNTAWKDNFTLFKTDVKTSSNSAKLRNAMGGELIAQAIKETNEATKKQMLTEAAGHLNEALKIHPGYKEPFLQLGNCYNYLEEYDKSIEYYNKVLQMNPGDENATSNMAITYRDAGRYWGQKRNDLTKSIANLQEARKRMPEDYETNRLLGVAYGMSNNSVRAIEYFIKATEIQPENADAQWNLGSAYMHLGLDGKANTAFEKAEQIEPGIREKKKAAERRRMESKGN